LPKKNEENERFFATRKHKNTQKILPQRTKNIFNRKKLKKQKHEYET